MNPSSLNMAWRLQEQVERFGRFHFMKGEKVTLGGSAVLVLRICVQDNSL